MNNLTMLEIIEEAVDILNMEGCHIMAEELEKVYEQLTKQFMPPAQEPHCSDHKHFEYDCLDCSDALERQREKVLTVTKIMLV